MALRIQGCWRRRQGKLAAHLKRQARKFAREQEELENRMALRIQCAWRRKKGTLVLQLKKQAMREAQFWLVVWDAQEQASYFFDESSGNSEWDMPEKVWKSGRHSDEWIVCRDERSGLEYYYCMFDGSVHPYDGQGAQTEWHGYNHPPPLALIALRGRHVPAQQ